MSRFAHGRGLISATLAAMALAIGCREAPKSPVSRPAAPESQAVEPPLSKPQAVEPAPLASAPASQPKPPKPVYTHEPPYRVATTIRSLDDPQAGWLRIESLADREQSATVTGTFPSANTMRVDTGNVEQLSIDLSMLPLQPRRSRILHIDRTSIELSQRHRGRIQLQRSSTGHWTVITPIPQR